MRRSIVIPSVAVALMLGVAALPATARDARDTRGQCSGGEGEWRLRVKPEGKRSLRVRFRIEAGGESHEAAVRLR